MNYYSFTLRKTTPVKTEKSLIRVLDFYDSWIKKFKQTYTDSEIDYHYEYVTKLKGHNVHIHAMIKSHRTQLYINPKKGFHVYIERCQSPIAWEAYITKDGKNRQDMLNLYKVNSNITTKKVNIREGSTDESSDRDEEDELIDVNAYPRMVCI